MRTGPSPYRLILTLIDQPTPRSFSFHYSKQTPQPSPSSSSSFPPHQAFFSLSIKSNYSSPSTQLGVVVFAVAVQRGPVAMRKPEKSTANGACSNTTSTGSKLRKGLWSPEEDDKLMNYMLNNGQGCWSDVARNAGLQRCGKSCRLRWINYLRPDLKRGAFSPQEEELIIHLHSLLGNRSFIISLCSPF